jgi:hypothetical protein
MSRLATFPHAPPIPFGRRLARAFVRAGARARTVSVTFVTFRSRRGSPSPANAATLQLWLRVRVLPDLLFVSGGSSSGS